VTVRETLTRTIDRLKDGGIESATAEAEWILGDLLQLSRTELLLQSAHEFPATHTERLDKIVATRLDGQPLQYILGYTEFYGRRFDCDSRALIPRPETEILVEVVLSYLKKNHPPREGVRPWILDIGTGTGNIAVTLAAERPDIFVVADDIEKPALGLADRNICTHGVEDRVLLLNASLLSPISFTPRFAVICSNPPYISPEAMKTLPREVRDFEPLEALYAPLGGLAFLRLIIAEAPFYLLSGGLLALEIGFDQADDVSEMLSSSPTLTGVTLTKDLAGHQRIVSAVRV